MTTPATLSSTHHKAARQILSGFRSGDRVTNWAGEIRHRYAGVIADLSQEQAETALLATGYTLTEKAMFIGGDTWTKQEARS